MQNIQYSIVVPVYNSAESIASLIKEIDQTLQRIGKSYEIIMVDDNSTDGSWTILQDLITAKSSLKLIKLAENSGQIAATTCGIEQSSGKTIITLDDDLQYPPGEIATLIKYYEENSYSMIFGNPKERMHGKGHGAMYVLGKFFFHQVFMRRYRNVNFFSTFRVFSRDIFFDQNNNKRGHHLFFIWDIAPDRYGHIDVAHETRKRGVSSYNLTKLISYYRPFLYYMSRKICLLVFVLVLSYSFLLAVLTMSTKSKVSIDEMNIYISHTWVLGLAIISLLSALMFNQLLQSTRAIRYSISKIT